MRDVPPQGSIEDVFLPRLVAGMHLHEFEGSLRLTLPGSIKILYFKKGEIASAASNAEPDRLANILIDEGRLTSEQLELARSRLEPGASLGKTLIELGFLSPTELLQGARRQVQVILASCFASVSGGYEMVPGPLPPEVTSLGLGTRRLLFDSLARSVDRAAIVREIGSMEAVYRPTDRLDLVLATLKLDSETDRIARLLNGAASLRDISGRTSHDDLTVGRVVLALELLGAAERLSAPEQEEPEEEEEEEEETAASVAVEASAPIAGETPQAAPAPADLVADDGAIVIEAEEAPPSAPPPAATEETPGLPNPAAVAQFSDPSPHLTTEPAPLSEAAEPPPIPPDELPAFTRPPDELPEMGPSLAAPEGAPRWEVDPVTGEKVHVGPIEMTFDGRIAQGSGESRNAMRLLLGAGAVTLVLGGALGYVLLRRGEGGPVAATRSSASAAIAAETPAPGPEAMAPEPVAIAPEPAAAAPGTAPDLKPAPAATPPPVEPAAPEAEKSVPPRTVATPDRAHESVAPTPAAAARGEAPSPAPAAAPATTPPPTAVPATRPKAVPDRPKAPPESASPATGAVFTAARQSLDHGDIAAAARQFESWVVAGRPDRFTLQIMIACQEETVRGAGSRAAADTPLFVLPYSLKGRACYRVCWGVYSDGEAARGALAQVPQALTGAAVPLVVPVSRLRSAG